MLYNNDNRKIQQYTTMDESDKNNNYRNNWVTQEYTLYDYIYIKFPNKQT